MPNRHALRSVREQRGLDLAEVATFTTISAARLEEFEAGERAPSRKQMDKLADAYGVPLYSLFREGIPNLPPLPIDFRKSDPTVAALSPRGFKSLAAAEKIATFTKQLALELDYSPASFDVNLLEINSEIERARSLREIFNEWLEPRADAFEFAGPAEQKFLSAFRLFFEVQGGVVNINDAPPEDYLGFYISPDAGTPAIFVNRKISSKKAQLFTLLHEYHHYVIGADGISNPFQSRNTIERSCNKFAAEFIAPLREFSAMVERLPEGIRSDVPRLVDTVSATSLLSRHATAIRLAEADYITRAQLNAWVRVFTVNPRVEKDEEREGAEGGGGNPHAKRVGELGYLPIILAKRAIDLKFIDRFDVADGIGLSESLQERAYSLAARRFEMAQP